jgi:cytochrome c biogenesis protein CcdA/thiol-disulfide isomerase/thioredoxin
VGVLVVYAFLSGIVTVLSPCILPALPLVLSGGITSGRARPLGVITGFILGFTSVTVVLAALVRTLGIPSDALRLAAVVFLVIFGLVTVVPFLSEGFQRFVGSLVHRGPQAVGLSGDRPRKTGFVSGIPVGLSLGLVWTPCVGPIMASVISLAASRPVDGGTVVLALAYSLGTAIPMFGIMVGGRTLLAKVPWLSRRTAAIQRGFGVLMILTGLAIGFGLDLKFQTAVLTAFPQYGTGLTSLEDTPAVRQALASRAPRPAVAPGPVFAGAPEGVLESAAVADYGAMPAFVAEGPWYNVSGPPPTVENLAGKVVLVDFWTYSCINCLRTLPYLKAWYQKYHPLGLEIIGVHTPEFAFEKIPANVARAVGDLGLPWPVVQDNSYAQWNAYSNQYWPGDYLVDPRGHVEYFHFGEGDYTNAETILRRLLVEKGADLTGLAAASEPAASAVAITPETYLGADRGSGYVGQPRLVADRATAYHTVRLPSAGEWVLEGPWTVHPQSIEPQTPGSLTLAFEAQNVFLVIDPAPGEALAVSLDGKPAPDTKDVHGGRVALDGSRLYQLVGLSQPGKHLLRLDVGRGTKLFAFTFG